MTDADADGSHIRCLLFGMFLRYLPFVIEQGKLFAGNPPLYGIDVGKKKKYFADNIDYIQYVQELFCSDNIICNINTKKKYSKKDITQILYKNMYYVEQVNKVSGTYSIDPGLLEFILYNKDLSFRKFKSTIEKQYRFIEVSNTNGTILISGLVNSKIQTVFVNDRLIKDCSEIIKMINKSEKYYLVNNIPTTLYQLMLMFNKVEPKHLTRYKGLGRYFAPYYSNIV